jgi:hypothetical protein
MKTNIEKGFTIFLASYLVLGSALQIIALTSPILGDAIQDIQDIQESK